MKKVKKNEFKHWLRRGDLTSIARRYRCTRAYVSMVLHGKANNVMILNMIKTRVEQNKKELTEEI